MRRTVWLEELGTERFLQEVDAGIQQSALGDDVRGVAGHEEHADVRVARGHLFGQVASAHLRHDDIREQQIDGPVVAGDGLERFAPAAGDENAVAP